MRRYIHGICSFCSFRLLCVNIIFNLQSYFYSLQSLDEVNIITSHLQIKTESCRRLHNLLKVMSQEAEAGLEPSFARIQNLHILLLSHQTASVRCQKIKRASQLEMMGIIETGSLILICGPLTDNFTPGEAAHPEDRMENTELIP